MHIERKDANYILPGEIIVNKLKGYKPYIILPKWNTKEVFLLSLLDSVITEKYNNILEFNELVGEHYKKDDGKYILSDQGDNEIIRIKGINQFRLIVLYKRKYLLVDLTNKILMEKEYNSIDEIINSYEGKMYEVLNGTLILSNNNDLVVI